MFIEQHFLARPAYILNRVLGILFSIIVLKNTSYSERENNKSKMSKQKNQ